MEILRLLDGLHLHTKIHRQTPIDIWLPLCAVQEVLSNIGTGTESKIPSRMAVFQVNFLSPNQISTYNQRRHMPSPILPVKATI